jgi:hypothetical protein
MKRLIAAVMLLLFVLISYAWIHTSEAIIEPSLVEKIINHPDAIEMAPGWFRIYVKENLSNTEYDWRFDMRMIETYGGHIVIGHRKEQNSGNMPESNWVIEYTFIDFNGDGTLDRYLIERFISIKDNDAWFKQNPKWPDGFNYPQDNVDEEEANKLFQKELEYWKSKL